ncbi:MAG: hypothetical protein AAF915_23375 [Cyanobacteria bacterium P01_D01_bin.50]
MKVKVSLKTKEEGRRKKEEGSWLEYLWGFKPQPNSFTFERWGIQPIRKKLIFLLFINFPFCGW